jgi:hypothetical protein
MADERHLETSDSLNTSLMLPVKTTGQSLILLCSISPSGAIRNTEEKQGFAGSNACTLVGTVQEQRRCAHCDQSYAPKRYTKSHFLGSHLIWHRVAPVSKYQDYTRATFKDSFWTARYRAIPPLVPYAPGFLAIPQPTALSVDLYDVRATLCSQVKVHRLGTGDPPGNSQRR